MERQRERNRNGWLYQLCVLSIGIPINPGGDFTPVDPGIQIPSENNKEEPKIPPIVDPVGPVDPIGPRPPITIGNIYYQNSIEEYRYSLYLANRSGSRTGLSKKKKSAESGIKFLQYTKTQREFMEFLQKTDDITYKRVMEYSNPSILKTPFIGGDFLGPGPRPRTNISSDQLPETTK
jgi:hypothetical protein